MACSIRLPCHITSRPHRSSTNSRPTTSSHPWPAIKCGLQVSQREFLDFCLLYARFLYYIRLFEIHYNMNLFLLFFLDAAVVSEDGTGGYSPTSTSKQQQSNHNGGGLPAFAQRFGTHTSSASAYTAAGSSRSAPSSYHPIATSGVSPYHLTATAVNNGGPADSSSLQWAAATAVAGSHGYSNTDGTINYAPMQINQSGRSRSNAFSAAASLSARKYNIIFIRYIFINL